MIPKKSPKTNSSGKKTKQKRDASASKSIRKKKRKAGVTIVPALKLCKTFASKRAADPDRDKVVSKALAQQATSILYPEDRC